MGWKQYRKIKQGEFIVVGYDMAMGGPDYSCAVFLSKTALDVPLIFHDRCVATEATNEIVPILEKISDITGVSPVIAPEANAGGVYEIERINALNRLNKFKMYKPQPVGNIDKGDPTKYGFITNTATRPKMLEDLKNAIDHRLIGIYDEVLIDELFSFIVVKSSVAWKAQAEQNSHDDLVMALAIAWQLYQTEEPHKLKADYKDFPDDTRQFNKGFY